MRQKLITLDPTTFELASKKKNFSEWVRLQLRLEADGHTFEAMDKELDQVYKQKEAWYRKYAALREEVGYNPGVKVE